MKCANCKKPLGRLLRGWPSTINRVIDFEHGTCLLGILWGQRVPCDPRCHSCEWNRREAKLAARHGKKVS